MTNEAQHTPGWLSPVVADTYLDALITDITWEQRKVFGGNVPRLDAWYHLDGLPYRFGGVSRHPVMVWPKALTVLFELVSASFDVNAVLCNLYLTGDNSVAWHSDDEHGQAKDIVSLSLGASRDFFIRSKENHASKKKFELSHGDLLVMSEASQRTTEHCLPKRKNTTGPRLNLTWRKFCQ